MKKRWQHKAHHNTLPVSTHRYLGQFELADGQWIYHTATGHYNLTDKQYYWHLCDRLGSTVAVIDSAANPLNNIDPTGRDWYSTNDNKVVWTNYHSQNELDKNNISRKYLGTAHVVFEGSRNEKLGKKGGKDGFIDGIGAITAKVTVYGPKDKDDIHTMTGYTMTSDAKAFGPIDEGLYPANYDDKGKKAPLPSNWVLNKRGRIRMMDGKENPYSPNQKYENGEGYKTGIFIHSTNQTGFAGKTVSVGCLLIAPVDFKQFNTIMKGVKSFTVQVSRWVTTSKKSYLKKD